MPTSHLEMRRQADDIEAAAYTDLFAAAPPPLIARLGIEAREVGGASVLIAPGIPLTIFNRAIGLGLRAAARPADLDAIDNAFAQAGCKEFWIHLTPGAEPSELPQWLLDRGYSPPARHSWAKLVFDSVQVNDFATDLDVREVKPGEEEAVAAAIAVAFGMPPPFIGWIAGLASRAPWRMFGAFDGTTAVGGSMLYLERNAAWLGMGGVRDAYRGRAAHRVLMALRMREALRSGCNVVITETGEPVTSEPNPSLTNMYRCGFRKLCSRLNYARVAHPG